MCKMFKQIFVAMAVIAATSADDPEERIFGGVPAYIDSRPFQVSLRNSSNFHFCGGSIVSDRWVLSAPHCFRKHDPSATLLVVGTDRLDTGGVTYNIENVIIHPDYISSNLLHCNDIALIKTDSTIDFTDNVAPISLPSAAPEGGDKATVSGWGMLATEKYPNQLQALNVTILSDDDCLAEYSHEGC